MAASAGEVLIVIFGKEGFSLHSFSKGLQKFNLVVVCLSLVVIVVMVAAQILFRNIIRIPLVWADEIARYAFIWLTAMGAGLMVREKGHFAISMFRDSFKYKKAYDAVIYTLMIATAIVMIVYGFRHVMVGLHTLSAAARIRMAYAYAAIPTGALFMLFYLIEMLLGDFGVISKKTPLEGDAK